MPKEPEQKILIWDIETAGVQGLAADRGFVVCFGYRWLWEKKAHCITLLDHPGKNCQDDTQLLKEMVKILGEAELLVAHFGQKFDKPFVQARLVRAGLPIIPMTRLADTCLIARTEFRLSSNRLGNLASFLQCAELKMEKKNGWPDWWMGVLRGDADSIRKMAIYCKQDVDCLADVFKKMRPIIPERYLLDRSIDAGITLCPACGSAVNHWGYYKSATQLFRRWRCKNKTCNKTGRYRKPLLKSPHTAG